MAKADPSNFIGMILGTLGHMAEGTRAKATPRTSMRMMANQPKGRTWSMKVKCTAVSITEPMSMRVAPLPTLS